MRVLVLGGTVFVSRAVAAEALRRGHEVVCAARGTSGPVPKGARLVVADRDVPDGLDALAGERFDAVVDVARMSLPWVSDALRTLAERAGHWTFVSTMSVYSDDSTPGQGIDGPLHEPLTGDPSAAIAEDLGIAYGRIKVASENAVREVLGSDAFIVRAGLIVGPGDGSDRFGYWPGRFARGGRAVVPQSPGQPTQFIDVRDLATWIVDAAEQRLGGTFNGFSPSRPLAEVLQEVATAVGSGVELVPVADEVLTAHGVAPWSGPRSLPLWLPPEYHGGMARDVAPALAAGLRIRPLADTALAALAHERALGLDRERKSGLSPAEEHSVLAGL